MEQAISGFNLIRRYGLFLLLLSCIFSVKAQVFSVNRKVYNPNSGVKLVATRAGMIVTWPAGNTIHGRMLLNMQNGKPLFGSIQLGKAGAYRTIIENTDPEFILTKGKRDLISQNGWNIFFDKVPLKPHQSYKINFSKKTASVNTSGSRTVISIDGVEAPNFKGKLEITLYNGQPLFNVAAVISTQIDSTAILYDAGLVSKQQAAKNILWRDVYDKMQSNSKLRDSAQNVAVKYRTIIAENSTGSIAVFPAPHQYFYPLDEAFNLKFVWYGNNYRNLLPGFGFGIRQDLYGDNRYVPWFNAPPGTRQRLNFFCLLSTNNPMVLLAEVKKYTHNDSYKPLAGYKTMSSHFHNEFISNVVLAGKPVADSPSFIKVFKSLGVNIVHLAEFHGTGHPRGPDQQRLLELKTLFEQCQRLSSKKFLLLPGEEPNEFFGGHWLAFFPKPVYWIMSRKTGTPFTTTDPEHGKTYHIGSKEDMFSLLKAENGLAWTAHARTKGSTGFPDAYKEEAFYKSDRFLGAAWKALPADLSQPRLGKRVLDLMDDMNNWGLQKKILAESDIFTIEPENEMYAHVNINYLKLNKLPAFKNGWQAILDVLQSGRFFSSTGEVLIPDFTVNNSRSGDTIQLPADGKCNIRFKVDWTFPLNFAEIISGDGTQVYRHRINLNETKAFGNHTFQLSTNLKNRKWVRLEVWDAAANGAFTQTVWIK
jgi:hypothetical protein